MLRLFLLLFIVPLFYCHYYNEPIPVLKKILFNDAMTEWTEIPIQILPKLGISQSVHFQNIRQLAMVQEFIKGSAEERKKQQNNLEYYLDLKIKFQIDYKWETNWITVILEGEQFQKNSYLEALDFDFDISPEGEIQSVKVEPKYMEEQNTSPALLHNRADLLSKTEHIHVHYHWNALQQVDSHSTLLFLYGFSLICSIAIVIYVLSSQLKKLY